MSKEGTTIELYYRGELVDSRVMGSFGRSHFENMWKYRYGKKYTEGTDIEIKVVDVFVSKGSSTLDKSVVKQKSPWKKGSMQKQPKIARQPSGSSKLSNGYDFN